MPRGAHWRESKLNELPSIKKSSCYQRLTCLSPAHPWQYLRAGNDRFHENVVLFNDHRFLHVLVYLFRKWQEDESGMEGWVLEGHNRHLFDLLPVS